MTLLDIICDAIDKAQENVKVAKTGEAGAV
jgi:hypothetical protein